MPYEERYSKIQEKMLNTFTKKEIDRALLLKNKQDKENPWFELDLLVLGDSVAAGRPRSTVRWKGKGKEKKFSGIQVYDDPKTRDYKIMLRKIIETKLSSDFVPVKGQVEITIDIFKKMPVSTSRIRMYLGELGYIRPLPKPDNDNYAKSVMDAVKGILWKDDAQCVDTFISKWYSIKPRMEIHIEYCQHRLDI